MLVPLRIIWLVKSHILMGDRPMSGITTWRTHHQLKNIFIVFTCCSSRILGC